MISPGHASFVRVCLTVEVVNAHGNPAHNFRVPCLIQSSGYSLCGVFFSSCVCVGFLRALCFTLTSKKTCLVDWLF